MIIFGCSVDKEVSNSAVLSMKISDNSDLSLEAEKSLINEYLEIQQKLETIISVETAAEAVHILKPILKKAEIFQNQINKGSRKSYSNIMKGILELYDNETAINLELSEKLQFFYVHNQEFAELYDDFVKVFKVSI